MFDDLPDQREPVNLMAQIGCVRRELRKRQTVYPRLIGEGKMTKKFAQEQIRTMTAVKETLCALFNETWVGQ